MERPPPKTKISMVPPFGTCDISKSGEKRSSSDLPSIDGTNGNEIDVNQRIESKLNIKPVLLCLNRKKTIPVRRKSQNIVRGMLRKLTLEFIKRLVDNLVITYM